MVAFITHGGMNSILETVSHGKPMIVIPLFAEQKRNAQIIIRAKIGAVLRTMDISTPKFKNAIEEVLAHKKLVFFKFV